LRLEDVELDRERALRAVVPVGGMLPTLAAVVLTPEGLRRAGHGRDLGPGDVEGRVTGAVAGGPGTALPERAVVRLLTSTGDLVGVARPVAGSEVLHPFVILR